MNYRRIIPCLDTRNGRLVKGVQIEGWGPAFIGALVMGLVVRS